MTEYCVSLRPFVGGVTERRSLFSLYEQALRPHIESAFGWDAEFQEERFESSYPSQQVHLVLHAEVVVGYVVLRELEGSIHIALLLLEAEHRGQGVGRRVMRQVERAAALGGKRVSLSCFKSNRQALSFYKQMGYRQVGEDTVFVELEQFSNVSYLY